MTSNGRAIPQSTPTARFRAGAISMLVGVGLLIAGGPHSARAEVPPAPAARAIAPGAAPVTGEITTGDREENGQYYDEYTLTLSRGDRVQIDMDAVQSTAPFDTYLSLLPPEGGEPLVVNDDRDYGTLNSTLVFEAPRDGVFRVRAQGFFGATGSYRLSVSRLEAPPAPARIATGSLTRSFGPASPVMQVAGGNARYAEYVFHGDAGDRVGIGVSSASPTAMRLFDVDGRMISQVEGEGLGNTRIVAVLRGSGDYRLQVFAPVQSTDTYSLALEKVAAPAADPPLEFARRDAPNLVTLALDSPVRTTTEFPWRVMYFYRYYGLRVRGGEELTLTLSSPPGSFQPALDAGGLTPLGFAVAPLEQSGGENVARLVIRPERSGVVWLRVRSVEPGIGTLTLRVEQSAPPAPARVPAR